MSWLDKLLPPKIKQTDPKSRKGIPEGLWIKCPSCEAVLYRNDVEANLHVCPKCSHHMRIGARERLDGLLDAEGRYEIGQEIVPVDSLKFKDLRKYPDRIKEAMDEAQRGLALDPHSPNANAEIGYVLLSEGDCPKAIAQFRVDMDRRDLVQSTHTLPLAPVKKFDRGATVGRARIRIADLDGEEFEEAGAPFFAAAMIAGKATPCPPYALT